MTGYESEQELERRLGEELDDIASGIEVPYGWTAIAARLDHGADEQRRGRPRLRMALIVCGSAIAGAAVLAAVVLGGGFVQRSTAPAPIATPSQARSTPVSPLAPHTVADVPLTIYRIGVYPLDNPEEPGNPFLSSERLDRPGSTDRGRAALQLWFDTAPLHHEAIDTRSWQRARVDSVTHRNGLIRVDFSAFSSSRTTADSTARLIAQSWVQTLQSTLDTEDPVRFTVRGKPVWLYGRVDSNTPVGRDDNVLDQVFVGLEGPRNTDVVRSPLALIGSSGGTEVSYSITNADSGQAATTGRTTVVKGDPNFTTALNLPPGNYQVTVSGKDFGNRKWMNQVFFTVVA